MINSIDSEYALIGSLVLMAEAKPVSEMYNIITRVDESDFSDYTCGTIYRFIKLSVMAESSFDVVSLYSQIEESRIPGPEIKFSDIGAIAMRQPGFSAIESHLAKVLDCSMRRKAIAAISNLIDQVQNGESVMQSLGLAESAIDVLMQKTNGENTGLTHMSELMHDWVERANAQYENMACEVGYTSGFRGADESLGESLIPSGSLVIVGANPGKGKTAVMVRMSTEIARQYPDRAVHVYSLEMPSAQIVDRLMGQSVNNKKPKHFDDLDWARIAEQMSVFKSTNLYVCDSSEMSVDQIKANARAAVARGERIGAIFVDYLTLLKMAKAERRDLSVGEVSKQCKRLAKELNCIVVLLSQLSRANMQRTNKRPINSDLRESGQIEADADLIYFPYYELLFDEEAQCGPFAELICSKNRHGAAETTYAKVVNGVWQDCDQLEARSRIQS